MAQLHSQKQLSRRMVRGKSKVKTKMIHQEEMKILIQHKARQAKQSKARPT
jgi:hypothetical protein